MCGLHSRVCGAGVDDTLCVLVDAWRAEGAPADTSTSAYLASSELLSE
jgi:hypothetical protein